MTHIKHTVKRVLLVTGGRAKRADSLNGAALRDWLQRQLGADYELTYGCLTEFVYYTGLTTTIYDPVGGYDIADFDLVVFRTIGKQLELGITAATYLQSKGVPFTDHYLLMPAAGKLACSFGRWAAGIAVPPTLYATPGRLPEALQRHDIGYPFVLKGDIAKKGRDNHLITSAVHLKKVLSSVSASLRLLAQPMIPNNGDYRVLVLDGRATLALLRRGDGTTHLNNVSTGAQASLIELSELPGDLIGLAERAARQERLTVAGVDILIDKTSGRQVILEVNRAPQLATGAFADEKMAAYAKAIERLSTPLAGEPLPPVVIGRSEHILLPDNSPHQPVPAKVDTGAYSSSIWASGMIETAAGLQFCLFAPGSPYYTGTVFTVARPDYSQLPVENSFGAVEVRYAVKLRVTLQGRTVNSLFTLADRSRKIYPLLLGRKLIRHGFVVDVSKGTPLTNQERRMRRAHQVALRENED